MAERIPGPDPNKGRNTEATSKSLAALRETLLWEQAFKSRLIANLPGLFMLVDEEGNCKRMNDALMELLGIPSGILPFPPITSWKHLSEDSKSILLQTFSAALKEGEAYEMVTLDLAGGAIEYKACAKKIEVFEASFLIITLQPLSEINDLETSPKDFRDISQLSDVRLQGDYRKIIGQSDALQYVLYRVEQVATSDTTVLIQGETGTGKELVARAIHENSLRKDGPMIRVNCANLPPELIESELFGHEKGAFTGAINQKIGRFELADGGTLFLDEIGEMPHNLQAKLLRALEEGEFNRLGSAHNQKVDVRIIAATNRDLKTEVQEGRFRKDLYFRLDVYPVTLPPLRQRKEDIPLLVHHFLSRFNKKLGKSISRIPEKTLISLQNYAWPGNIRELEHVIERAMILSRGAQLVVEIPSSPSLLFEELKPMAEIEKEYIIKVLESTNGRISGPKGAARILDINPSTLRSRMLKLGIRKSSVSYDE